MRSKSIIKQNTHTKKKAKKNEARLGNFLIFRRFLLDVIIRCNY